jgi:hypothetical protein
VITLVTFTLFFTWAGTYSVVGRVHDRIDRLESVICKLPTIDRPAGVTCVPKGGSK